jgi:hypothetical protein
MPGRPTPKPLNDVPPAADCWPLTAAAAATRLGLRTEAITRAARAGTLPGVRTADGWRFRPADVDAFAAGRAAGARRKPGPRRLLADDLVPPDPGRLALFAALVECWNDGLPPDLARQVVARRFAVAEAAVREVEALGVKGHWPALGE